MMTTSILQVKRAILFVNGAAPSVMPVFEPETVIACTDGAYHYLADKITCNYVVGDFDSIDPALISSSTQFIHTPDQNKTDIEKALYFLLTQDVTHINVYGATGKEHDHFFGNLATAVQFRNRLSITFFDDYGYFFLLPFSFTFYHVKGKTISLIPFCHADGVTTEGLRYPLRQKRLDFGGLMSLRNHAVNDQVTLSYTSGNLFVFIYPSSKNKGE